MRVVCPSTNWLSIIKFNDALGGSEGEVMQPKELRTWP
jgi:hypothetical protein